MFTANPTRIGRSTLALALLILTASQIRADEPLARRATWTQPSPEAVKSQLNEWLGDYSLDGSTKARVDALWSDPRTLSDLELLDRLATTFAMVHDGARGLVSLCRGERTSVTLPEFELLNENASPGFMRDNLRMLYGGWLIGEQLYNEALEQLGPLQPEDVVAPASLLFYQSVAQHRLLDKEKALASIARLLENEPTIPRRYATVAQLMEADMQPLEVDSLDEISRLMDSIQIRLGHARAGRRVRKEEDDVVAKLDKIIKQLEQMASKRQSGSGSRGSLRPSQPMQDSNPGGGTGPGNVDPKQLTAKDSWGNLPPKERQEALQQLGKEYPSHYRDVIEEYFRKLARDDTNQP